jgi:phosphotransferase system enzyme I (PtsI)
MFSLHGSGIGGGVVIGRARVIESGSRDVERRRIGADEIALETERLDRAIAQVKAELQGLADHLPESAPAEAGALLEVHAMILDDPMLVTAARAAIAEQLWNAEWALWTHAGQLAAQFSEFEDAYLRERGRDVDQVAERVLGALSGSRVGPPSLAARAIIVARDLSPADMLGMREASGFVIELGGSTSHTAILARSMNVPAVIGASSACQLIQDDDWLILDGDAGVVIVSPDEGVLAQYRARQAAGSLERARLQHLVSVVARTLDGLQVSLQANIERPDEAAEAVAAGAEGVGLFRSEFLFMNRSTSPGEDEQFEAYRQVVLEMAGRPVTIRTIDIGADKVLEGGPALHAANPALGRRAIRYALAAPDLFLTQIRAILRAAALGPVRLLIPMIAHDHEITASLELIDRAREQLLQEGVRFDPAIAVGAMIEVPAAALCAGHFARRLDFLSIGTNDLVQYTLAIDRADHEVAALYDPYHPAVLKLIAGTLRAARKAGKPISLCGEMAGDPAATRLLLGMGLAEFSMQPSNLLRVKREVLRADAARLSPRVTRVIACNDPVRSLAMIDRLRGL